MSSPTKTLVMPCTTITVLGGTLGCPVNCATICHKCVQADDQVTANVPGGRLHG